MICDQTLRERYLCKIITQYRQSPKLIEFIAGHLDILDAMRGNLCENLHLPSIADAQGKHLDVWGSMVGFPRCHCSAKKRLYFGFNCEGDCGCGDVATGFCTAWKCKTSGGLDDFCFEDDDMYRRFILAKSISNNSDGSVRSILACASVMFDKKTIRYDNQIGKLTISVTRKLTKTELNIMPLIKRILPVYPSVEINITHGDGIPFGFGEGWAGVCGNFSSSC